MTTPNAIVFQLNRGLNNGGGFFSVFFFMCNAYLHARSLGVPFYIEHRNWPYTYHEGWHDYFTSLKVRTGFPVHKNVLRSSHMMLDIHPPYSFYEYSQCIQSIFALRPEIKERINHLRRQIGSEYTALFVRRGDKIRETPYVAVADILSKVSYTQSTVFFIQTDDYTVVEEARTCLPTHRIVSTVPVTKRGSYHSLQFLKEDTQNKYKDAIVSLDMKPKDQIYEETTEMLVGLAICITATACWTDIESNVGRFLKLANPSIHTYPEDIVLNLDERNNPAFKFKDNPTS